MPFISGRAPGAFAFVDFSTGGLDYGTFSHEMVLVGFVVTDASESMNGKELSEHAKFPRPTNSGEDPCECMRRVPYGTKLQSPASITGPFPTMPSSLPQGCSSVSEVGRTLQQYSTNQFGPVRSRLTGKWP